MTDDPGAQERAKELEDALQRQTDEAARKAAEKLERELGGGS